MITEQDLQAAIAECEGQRNPNANTCIKLAAFYTIRDHLFPQDKEINLPTPVYSGGIVERLNIDSDTEFARIANKTDPDRLMAVIDDLMTTIQILQPRLYDGVLRKLLDN